MKFIDYSIKNTAVTIFILAVLTLGGVFSYLKLGKLEDPSFTIKEAVVITMYPGAEAHRVELEVTDEIEEALQKIPNLEYLESLSKNGYSQVKVKLNEDLPNDKVDQYWDIVRKKLVDAKYKLPKGVMTPVVVDDYGSVYGMYLAVTGDGFSYAELEKYSRYIKKHLNSISGVAKIEEFGFQAEAVYLDIDREKLASMNLNPKLITTSLINQNIVSTGADIDYGSNRISLGLDTQVNTVDSLKDLIVFSKKLSNGSNNIVRLGDIAQIRKDYIKPYTQKMYYQGKQSLGLSLAPEDGTNVLITGKLIDRKIKELKGELPAGIEVEKIYYQPDLVKTAINNFIINLVLSVSTVLGVLLFFMGLKSGIVIGAGLIFSIIGTFIFMIPLDISLQRVSLGSFIIAMGMLVDNSIVIVDGYLVKRQEGIDKKEALLTLCHKNSLPLLGGTLIACIAFLPGSIMASYVGEYTKSSFWVISVSLLLSWLLCLTQTPVFCKIFLKDVIVKEPKKWEVNILNNSRKFLEKAIESKKKILGILMLCFAVSLVMFTQVPRSFFPDSDKKMFRLDIWVREGNKIEVVEKKVDEIRDFLRTQDCVVKTSVTIGGSPARYFVSTIPQMPDPTFAQMIVEVEKLEDIKALDGSVRKYVNENMPGVMAAVKKYPNGTATEYPIEAEFRGRDPQVLRQLAEKAAAVMKKSPNALNVKNNWGDQVLSWDGGYSQISAKKAGIGPVDTIQSLMINNNGAPIGRIQSEDKLIPVLLKESNTSESKDFKDIGQTPVWGVDGEAYPLSSFVTDSKLIFKDNKIWRRNRTRSIKVLADLPVGFSPTEVLEEFKDEVEAIELPEGYTFEWKGQYYEEKANSAKLLGSVPLVSVVMFTICVLLFEGIVAPALIFITLPLALIGIAPGLLITGKSFGFMSIIGVVALSGIMIKNLIVLMDEINYQIIELGVPPKEALVESAISRLRAVSLGALTTIFGMIPLLWDPLYGDMSATIIFGLLVSTILTIYMFPVMYAAVKDIK